MLPLPQLTLIALLVLLLMFVVHKLSPILQDLVHQRLVHKQMVLHMQTVEAKLRLVQELRRLYRDADQLDMTPQVQASLAQLLKEINITRSQDHE
ncbi:hypothetical protein SAMN05421823_11921 [Catalinimonas alkaloidigena]|uniref:Uncharacterized protein n=1 Tax=Catalinimonas alkaloidigena TaxID=1075417 RepID=A0A1G9V5L5_9BACT|nr:hypothetical protein [Catalinimonas alkaloidigena]SDM67367.1 hypothetical protein SAMN05421823_11921 [Catalinimonas alkaloidigena]